MNKTLIVIITGLVMVVVTLLFKLETSPKFISVEKWSLEKSQ